MFFGLFSIIATAALFAVVFFLRKSQAGAAASSGAPGGYGPTEADRLATPDGPRLRAAVAKGQLAELSNWIQSLPPGTWGDRSFLADLFGPHCEPRALADWARNEPQNALPRLLLGCHAIGAAWQARGHGQSVTEQGKQQFRTHLQQAEVELRAAAALDPADPSACAFLITVARGLNQGATVAQQWFAEAKARDPEHEGAHRAMLTFLCEKWHGSHDQMFAFARQAAAGARRGSTLPALVILAHLERWLYFKLFERDAAGEARYLQDPQVIAEVNAAFEHSLGAPELPFRMSTRRAHNDAAVFFWLVKDKARLQRQCQVLGNCYTDMCWQALGEPNAVYGKAYQWAMR
ncbi:MAG: hypothetical protein ABJB12_12290 [Pseudomonadota bacterium]